MVILDRYEGNMAVIEVDGQPQKIPRSKVADNTKEGSVLIKRDDIYYPDDDATNARRQEIVGLQDSLFN